MAQGDYVTFGSALKAARTGGWVAADNINIAILTNATTPTKAFASPTLASFTEVATAGTYVAGGLLLATWDAINIATSDDLLTVDSAVDPTWAQDAGNSTDAFWGLVYNVTNGQGLGFLDLGGPKDMTSGPLTITWNALGLTTITRI